MVKSTMPWWTNISNQILLGIDKSSLNALESSHVNLLQSIFSNLSQTLHLHLCICRCGAHSRYRRIYEATLSCRVTLWAGSRLLWAGAQPCFYCHCSPPPAPPPPSPAILPSRRVLIKDNGKFLLCIEKRMSDTCRIRKTMSYQV